MYCFLISLILITTPVWASSTDTYFHTQTRCVSAEALEVCTPEGCSSAPCMGGSYCIETRSRLAQAQCMQAENIQESCENETSKKISMLIEDEEVQIVSSCPNEAPACYKGQCVYPIVSAQNSAEN